MMKILKNKKALILSLIVLFLLCGSIAALVYQHFHASSGTTALIYQDGTLLREVSLSSVDAPYTFTITDEDGGYNTIQVEEGKIGIIDANCPDKICQNMGMVSSTAYPISCLPHKLMIKISSNDAAASDGLDAVTN